MAGRYCGDCNHFDEDGINCKINYNDFPKILEAEKKGYLNIECPSDKYMPRIPNQATANREPPVKR